MTSIQTQEPTFEELSKILNIPIKDLEDPPRRTFKNKTSYLIRCVKAQNQIAPGGLYKGALTANLHVSAVDEAGNTVRAAVGFITLAYPSDTDNFKFEPETRERCMRSLFTWIQAARPELAPYASKVDKSWFDAAGNEVVNKTLAFKVSRMKCLAEVGKRMHSDGSEYVGTQLYGEVYIATSKQNGKQYVNWQNFRLDPPSNLVLDPKQMLEYSKNGSEASPAANVSDSDMPF